VSFDPSTVAAQVQALIARCDFGQFALTTTSGTTQLSAGHPYQNSFLVTPATPKSAISWSGVYRGSAVSQPPLIVNTAQSSAGQAAVLDAASKYLDQADLHADQQGANPNTYQPTGRGP
jgi:hypothetical protein